MTLREPSPEELAIRYVQLYRMARLARQLGADPCALNPCCRQVLAEGAEALDFLADSGWPTPSGRRREQTDTERTAPPACPPPPPPPPECPMAKAVGQHGSAFPGPRPPVPP